MGPFYCDKTYSMELEFLNIGQTNWPSVNLKKVNGDMELLAKIISLSGSGAAGHSFKITVELTTPAKPGSYIAVFRLTHGNDIEFGDKATIDMKVEAKPEDVVPQVLEPSPQIKEEVPILAFDNVEPLKQIKIEEPAKVAQPVEEAKVVEPVEE
jgi:hypothetical protein